LDTSAQCTLMPSNHEGTESIHISGVTGGSQELTVLEAKISLTGKDWQKHPIVTGPGVPCILGIDYLRRGYFKDPIGYRWAFGIAAVDTEDVKQLSVLPCLSEGVATSGRATGTDCYRSGAQTAVPLNQGLLAPHSEVDLSTRESGSDKQNSLTF